MVKTPMKRKYFWIFIIVIMLSFVTQFLNYSYSQVDPKDCPGSLEMLKLNGKGIFCVKGEYRANKISKILEQIISKEDNFSPIGNQLETQNSNIFPKIWDLLSNAGGDFWLCLGIGLGVGVFGFTTYHNYDQSSCQKWLMTLCTFLGTLFIFLGFSKFFIDNRKRIYL